MIRGKSFAAGAISALVLSWPAVAVSANTIPDLSGLWARNSLEFEQPKSGPGPITAMGYPDGTSIEFQAKIGDYTNPILQPWAAERVKALGELGLKGIVFPDPENQCLPLPLPNILRFMQIEILQQPHQVVILYSRSGQVRHVRLNESHPAKVPPSSYGDSVGRYEDGALVIDTIGIKVGAHPMVDWYGTPYTEALHVVEHYRLIDYQEAKEAIERHEGKTGRIPPGASGIEADLNSKGKGLQIEITVDDTGAFTKPWSALVTFRGAANSWAEDICAENLRDAVGPERQVPRDDTPDF